MKAIDYILQSYLKSSLKEIDYTIANPFESQERILKNIITTASKTEWGRKHQYASIKTYQDFQKQVPVSSYETIFPFIDRMMKGEKDILWPGSIDWFSKSSGTTNAKSKFIPVSNESLKECHYKGGKDMLAMYFRNFPESNLFDGKGLAIGGTFSPNSYRDNSWYGDVSAVIMKNLPFWAQYARTPDIKTAVMDEWESKIQRIAEITIKKNVTNISGVPTWTIVLLDKILEMTGKDNVFEVWPNFECFYHGAVSFTPYRTVFEKYFPGKGINYIETYNASEGFFAMQDRLKADDMVLLANHGIFYEFIPLEEIDKEYPKAFRLGEVELNKNYAIVITTNAGLCRYVIGDTVKFTSINPYRIKVSGRTKHFINAFGEELIIENAESAIAEASTMTNAILADFTAAPIYIERQNKGGHEWVIEFVKEPSDWDAFVRIMDEKLKAVNSDYEAKRYKDIALQMPIIHSAPQGTFYKWMKKRGKLGGQHKVPRLSNTREYLDDILKYLPEK